MTKNLTIKPRTYAALFLLAMAVLSGSNASAGTITTLYSFSPTSAGINSDGSYPGQLILGKDGSFYGASLSGGTNASGAVYKITSDGVFTALYSFNGDTDGSGPNGLTEGARGSFYGTTRGNNNDGGTVFKLSTDGTPTGTTLTTLYTFSSVAAILCPPQGDYPRGVLALDGAGNIYGTTEDGGNGASRQYGEGTVFKMTTDGTPGGTTLTTLHDFGTLDRFSHNDGALPAFGLTMGSDGNFYGTTAGTVFQVTPSGVLTTLHEFTQGDHGYPQPSALLEGPAGIFYGMNVSDGDLGLGQLFEFTAGGDYAVIHAFADPPWLYNNYAGTNLDGAYPASWVKASDGSLYGITTIDGPYGYGTLFKLTTDGTAGGTVLTTLYAFSSPYSAVPLPEGSPTGVVLGTDRTIYGTMGSGANNTGAIFRYDPVPVIVALPPTTVQIAGTIAPGGAIQFIATQASTVSGLIVRVQYTTTTNIEGSWTDLPDGNGGHLQLGAVGTYSFGTVGTTFYPAGTMIYFRAITSAPGYTDSISNPILAPALEQAQLEIGLELTTTSDPTGALQTARIGDNLTNTLTWTNIGNAPALGLQVSMQVPEYFDSSSGVRLQFPKSALVYNSYGTYFPATSSAANDAKVVWNVANLKPGYSQSVTLLEKLGPTVRLDQQIVMPNNYEVSSTSYQPPTPGEGAIGGTPLGTTVLGPISFTLVPGSTTVAPGGLITYTMKVQNLASYPVANVVMADPVPEFTSFVSAAFVNSKGAAIAAPVLKFNNTPVANPLRVPGQYPLTSLPPKVQIFLAANPQITMPSDNSDEIVFYVGTLAARASASVKLTVQAGFEPPASFSDQEVKNLDYTGVYTDATGALVVQKNPAGNIFTPVAGTVRNAPNLQLTKFVAPENTSPGATVAVILMAHNIGLNAANDVFIQDSFPTGPDNAVFPLLLTTNGVLPTSDSELNSTILFVNHGSSVDQSKANFFVTLQNGNVLTIHGLHLEPNATVALTYFMIISPSTPVPESLMTGTCFIGGGNGSQSTNGTGTSKVLVTVPTGYPGPAPLNITGSVQLVTPARPIEVVTKPMITTSVTATVTQLDALFKKTPNASLVVKNSKGVPGWIPGIQRYLLHYQNTGVNAASDVHLLFQTPANTEFYRASFMSGGNFVQPGNHQSISPEPSKLAVGDVVFNIGVLGAYGGGYCMVEVILLPGAVSQTSSQVLPAPPEMYSGTSQPHISPRKLDDSNTNGTVVYDGLSVPSTGFVKSEPQFVHAGDPFDIQVVLFNTSDVFSIANDTADVTLQAPAGAQIVGFSGNDPLNVTSTSVHAAIYMVPHGADGFTVHLVATGAAGTTINDNSIVANIAYRGIVTLPATTIQIVDPQKAIPNTTTTSIVGGQFVTLGDMAVIPLGQRHLGGYALVCGPQTGFGALGSDAQVESYSTNDGNEIVYGPAQEIQLTGLPVLNNTDTKTILANLPKIVGEQGGNIFNGPEDNLLGPDGVSLIDNDTGGVNGTIAALLKTSGVGVIASGTGALPSVGTGSPALVAAGTAAVSSQGHIVTAAGGAVGIAAGAAAPVISNDGGSLIGQDGGALISNDGGSVVSNDGGSVVGPSGGTLTTSLQSAASMRSPAGNTFSGAGP